MSIYLTYIIYRTKAIPTKKPGVDDYYIKNVYEQIANSKRQGVPYFDDKSRYDSTYYIDYVKQRRNEDFITGKSQTIKTDLSKYEYSHDTNLVNMITDKSKTRNENYIREKL